MWITVHSDKGHDSFLLEPFCLHPTSANNSNTAASRINHSQRDFSPSFPYPDRNFFKVLWKAWETCYTDLRPG